MSETDIACRGQAWGAESEACLAVIAKEAGKGEARKIRLIAAAEARRHRRRTFSDVDPPLPRTSSAISAPPPCRRGFFSPGGHRTCQLARHATWSLTAVSTLRTSSVLNGFSSTSGRSWPAAPRPPERAPSMSPVTSTKRRARPGRSRSQLAVDGHAAGLRHAQIAEDDVGVIVGQDRGRRCPRRDDARLDAHQLENVGKRGGDVGLVVDDQRMAQPARPRLLRDRRRCWRRQRPAVRRRSGRRSARPPRSGSCLDAARRSTCEMDRPMPVPTPTGLVVK